MPSGAIIRGEIPRIRPFIQGMGRRVTFPSAISEERRRRKMSDLAKGLEITAVGLLIVFSALIIVALVTSLLSTIVNRLEKSSNNESASEEPLYEDGGVTPAIIAAISAVLGCTVNEIGEIRIRPIDPGQ